MLTVGEVFGSQPRAGGKFWWTRERHTEETVSRLFRETTSKKVVLIDGPSGAGKTSLAYRTLYRTRSPYNYVAVDRSTTWRQLCQEIVSVPARIDEQQTRKFGFSIRNFLPTGKVDSEHTERFDALRDLEFAEKYLDQITPAAVVRIMLQENVALVVDDFEKAGGELIERIADLAKKLSNPIHNGSASKLIVLSCGRSYEDLIENDHTLIDRVHHVTLGGLRGEKETWAFLAKGLDVLGVIHPGTSKLAGERAWLQDCAAYTYDATGGILKSLTGLGETIALKAERTKSLTGKSLVRTAKKQAQNNIDQHVRRLDQVSKLVAGNEHVAAVLQYIYQNGINRPHEFADIQRRTESRSADVDAESGVSMLIEHEFLVPTGMNGSVVFSRKPTSALAFSVALFRASHYQVPQAIVPPEFRSQELPLVVDWNRGDASSQ